MRLVEDGEALTDAGAAGEAIVADDVAGEARRAAEPRGHSVAALIEHRRAIGRFDHVGHMAGRRDVGDTYGHAIVEQVEYLADQDAGIEGDRLAGFDHHVAVGRRAHLPQKGDKIVDLIIGARDMVAAAEIDPFELVEEGTQHWLHRVPGALERREILFATAVQMAAADSPPILGEPPADSRAQAATWGGGGVMG